ncbi:uncharacterized protein LOC112572409 [Pomacea canaliculata]|uniref:uncharacterized protein LOC112572409 n=1 Tax=Pomacea canaliculata TaxID=400727 RepID=UPI000D72A058|nr:uncharacterized protein LOC112572409 [Pomacea canaliculata]
MAFVRSSSSFTRVLLILCVIRGVMASNKYRTNDYEYREDIKMECNSSAYKRNETHIVKCEFNLNMFRAASCTEGSLRWFRIVRDKNRDDTSLCRMSDYNMVCKENPKGSYCVRKPDSTWIYHCKVTGTEQLERREIFCMVYCNKTVNNKAILWLVSKDSCYLVGPPTATPPTAAAPTAAAPTTAAPEKEFPIWAAVLIAVGIGGLIALCVCLMCRKRRQAQSPVQDPEGGNTENPEGEEAEGEGQGDAEEEESESAESAESAEKSEETA